MKAKIEDIPGVGPAISRKLQDAGYSEIMAIAVTSPRELAEICEIGDKKAMAIIEGAKLCADIGGFECGEDIIERLSKISKLTTGSKAFDKLMNGGLETQSIVELFGSLESSKTRLCLQFAVNATLPKEKGGLDSDVVYIDTKNAFSPESITNIAKYLGVNPEIILRRIHVARAYTSHDQIILVQKAMELAEEFPIKLMIVDSIAPLFKAEYVGRAMFGERQQMLNGHMHDLLNFATANNAAVIVTNEVSSETPKKSFGGHIVGHTAAFRIYIRKTKSNKIVLRLIDSPNLLEGEATFVLSENGIMDC